MAGIVRTKDNRLKLGTPRTIYMDAGVWGGPEQGLPQMTFGLMEHNGIALCSYFSSGKNVTLPVLPDLGYDFHKTYMSTFLTLLMQKKYGVKLEQRDLRKGFHVLKIFPFAEKELLDETAELRILVPDLHLHFFKDTYLDNFITYYGNECTSNAIKVVKLGKRTSMETDFGIFLETIAEFQKSVLPQTRIHFLGDLCELWETESIVRYYVSADQEKKIYALLDDLGKWVRDTLEQSPAAEKDPRFKKLKGYVKELTKTKLADTPLDPETKRQLESIYKKSNAQHFLFEPDEDQETVKQRSLGIRSEIFKKHHGKSGKSFTDLWDEISWKIIVYGNHDNYLSGINEPNNTFAFSPLELQPYRFKNQYTFKNCAFLFSHGHNMDFFNNDEACALGRVITCLLVFYELKRRGDLVRKFEGLFRSDEEVRLDHIKKIARLCYLWEKKDREYTKKNKVIVLAHTHIPDLRDMSNEALIWKWAEDAWPKPVEKPQKSVRHF
jgi:hypothetical protein